MYLWHEGNKHGILLPTPPLHLLFPCRSFAESLSLYIILIYPNVALRVFTGTLCLIMAITIKCDSNTPWMVYQMKFIWSRTLLDLGSSDNKSHFHVGGVSQCSERLRKTSKKGFVRFMRKSSLIPALSPWISICLHKLIIRKPHEISYMKLILCITDFVNDRPREEASKNSHSVLNYTCR